MTMTTMMTTAQRTGQTLVQDLVSWVGGGAPRTLPLEEYVDGDLRVLRADLPGVDPDRDLAVSLEDGVLRIRGERRAEEHGDRRTELIYGAFERSVRVPCGTAAEDVAADYVDGVLTVTVPAAGRPAGSRVPVNHPERRGD